MIENTNWKKVYTNMGQLYYFNSASKESSWLIPPEIADIILEQEEMEAKRLEALNAEQAKRKLEQQEEDDKLAKKQKVDA
jgi:hypothetical protein